jgi:hypothetical protein
VIPVRNLVAIVFVNEMVVLVVEKKVVRTVFVNEMVVLVVEKKVVRTVFVNDTVVVNLVVQAVVGWPPP